MKILWINPEFLDYRIAVYQSLQKLSDNNFYLIFSGRTTTPSVAKKTMNTLKEHAIPLYEDKQIVIGSQKSDLANSYLSIRYPKKLMGTIKKIKPDIIICEGFFKWTPYALFQAKKMRIPVLIVYERTMHTERNCPAWRTMARRILSPFISGFIINGILTSDYLNKIGYGDKPMIKGCMAADSKQLSSQVKALSPEIKENLKAKLGIKQGLTYLYIGQMVERKGVQYLLPAWNEHIKKYPQDKLILVGTGILLEEFQKSYKNNKSILFTGKISYEEIHRYYAIADVFVIPTLEDNWSLVVPEAMACSLPIATSIYNGCHPELIEEGKNGYTFDPLKQESIIETLEKFHYSDLVLFGAASYEKEHKYTPEKVANKIFNFTKQINENINSTQ